MSDPRDRSDPPGLDPRRARGPVRRKGIGPSPSGWLDPRGRAIGSWAFAVNRVTGLGLLVYLYLHLGVLSLLLAGESAWTDFLELATSTVFLLLDVLLLFGLLFHGLNGVRVALVGSGIVPNRQRALFWAGSVIGTVVLAYGAVHILGSA
jgi:succinate dehydrogenase / fumarate reductase, cytochrome b subunit